LLSAFSISAFVWQVSRLSFQVPAFAFAFVPIREIRVCFRFQHFSFSAFQHLPFASYPRRNGVNPRRHDKASAQTKVW